MPFATDIGSVQGARPLRTADLLRVAGQRLGCAAVGVVTDDASLRRIWARDSDAQDAATILLASVTRDFVARTISAGVPLIENSVPAPGGSFAVCRLAIVPLQVERRRPVGALVVLNLPADPEFQPQTLQRAQRFARTLVRHRADQSDPATGLLNWSGLKQRLGRILASVSPSIEVAVLYGNLDRLHLVNSTLGMAAGDRVILQAAIAIRRRLAGQRCIASRLSGDRFLVVLPDCGVERAKEIAEDMRNWIGAESRRVFGVDQPASISWGIVATAAAGLQIDECIANAELACRAAKDRGRNRVEVFGGGDLSMIRRHDDLGAIRLLRDGLHEGRIVAFAQPIVSLRDASHPTSYELLIRLRAADDRLVEPAEFMSAATRYQMLPELDRAMVQHVFRQLRGALPARGRLPFAVSLNLCGPTLSDPQFADWMVAEMASHGIPGDQLTIEITESIAATNLGAIQSFIERLRRERVRFALDDFGTGINSLSTLKHLEVAAIKLDGSYVRDIESNPRSEALVRAIVQLADSMAICTVAEFVETASLRERLAALGVQFAQGHAAGRPEPLEQVLRAHATADAIAIQRAV